MHFAETIFHLAFRLGDKDIGGTLDDAGEGVITVIRALHTPLRRGPRLTSKISKPTFNVNLLTAVSTAGTLPGQCQQGKSCEEDGSHHQLHGESQPDSVQFHVQKGEREPQLQSGSEGHKAQ